VAPKPAVPLGPPRDAGRVLAAPVPAHAWGPVLPLPEGQPPLWEPLPLPGRPQPAREF